MGHIKKTKHRMQRKGYFSTDANISEKGMVAGVPGEAVPNPGWPCNKLTILVAKLMTKLSEMTEEDKSGILTRMFKLTCLLCINKCSQHTDLC